MASQRFCLRWNNHQSNLLSVFDQLLHAETFTDVTLAVEGQYLKAHKMVLSACSPYFNALFVNHPEKHPIVILKDVPYSDMKSLLDFMYRGEVSVDQERLTAFLRVAESLRIKGLTEVNDDKPGGAAPTPPPPQLHRIQPYLVQQRNKAHHNMLNINEHQQSLLGTALSSMPKRKRGRPRKLSGSSNGTGNDFDEYDRDGRIHDSPKHEIKMSGDGYSGNEGSDENQRESCDNDQDTNDCRDSRDGRTKKRKSQSKDRINNDNDNSTSVHLNNSPELSQRLFGVNKPPPPPLVTLEQSSILSTNSTAQNIQVNHTPSQHVSNSTQIIQISSATAANNNKQKQTVNLTGSGSGPAQTQVQEIFDPATHLPTALGLKIRVHPASQKQQDSNQQQVVSKKSSSSSSSMLQQQLRCDSLSNNNNNNKNNNSCQVSEGKSKKQISEQRQLSNDSNTIQPPSSNNLHHQFLLHMATNPIVKTEYLLNNETNNDENVMPIEVSSSPHSNSNANAQNDKSETEGATPTIIDLVPSPINENDNTAAQQTSSNKNEESPPVTPRNQRPVQRRRIRRKAQSTIDDQAEHLTEMSVRGLDLFRYASINEGVYQCTECAKENVQKTFKNKYSFQRHAFLYHEGKHRKVFPCPVCGKEFSRPDKMKNHMKMTHEGFVPKDVNYHPLNYLITAAAAGDIQHLFQQIDHNNTEANSGESLAPTQQTSTQQSLMKKLKNEIHPIHEISPSPPPPMGSLHEGNIIAAHEEVK